jgi:signal transduction protein with GAF and PtsI domain
MTENGFNYYQGLFELTSILNTSSSSKEIVSSFVEHVARCMKAKGCALMLLTPEEKILFFTASYGLSDWFVRKGPVIIDKSMTETLKGNPLVVLDAVSDERVLYHKQLKQEGIASILSIPLNLRNEVIGVMRIYTSEPYQFTEADINFASNAANFGAIAFERAHCYDSLQQDYESFKQDMLQCRAELGDEWAMEPEVSPPKERIIAIPFGG